MPTMRTFKVVLAAAMLSTSSYVLAQAEPANVPEVAASAVAASSLDPQFAKFAPKPDPVATRIDYGVWDDALKYMVFRMGRSIREGATRPNPGIGTRRVYGHDSRFRLEGNRIIFSFLDESIIASLTEYRKDLEATADLIDISTLSKNEQLAYWMNLHNAAVIEQIALEYPVSYPSRMKVGDDGLTLDEAPFITVAGVKMSPKDIRTKIVYANWKNPKVIYGFFRGEIGGPSIQADAFSAENVGDLLDKSGKEFVNSLRGTEKRGQTLHVSEIYEEARPFLFPDWPTDIRLHMLQYTNEEVSKMVEETSEVRASIYERAISDLANGEQDPEYNFKDPADGPQAIGVPAAVQRLLGEHAQKINKIIRRTDLEGRVTIIDVGDLTKPRAPEEVE